MSSHGSWWEHRNWIATVTIVGLIIAFTAWYLHSQPQQITLFLAVTVVALCFVVVMFSLPKYRRRFLEAILAHNARERKLGRLYLYQRVATAVFFVSTAVLFIIWTYQLIPSQYLALSAITYLIVGLICGIVAAVGFLRTTGKWGLMIIAVIAVIAAIRISLWALSRK